MSAVSSAPTRVCRVGGRVLTFDSPKLLWKKGHLSDRECIIRLILPVGERLVYPIKPSHSWQNNKLRASTVICDGIEELDGEQCEETIARSPHHRSYYYRVGEKAVPSDFCDDAMTTDGPGIHCYATRVGAQNWGRVDYRVDEWGPKKRYENDG